MVGMTGLVKLVSQDLVQNRMVEQTVARFKEGLSKSPKPSLKCVCNSTAGWSGAQDRAWRGEVVVMGASKVLKERNMEQSLVMKREVLVDAQDAA